jgi:restriction system protein
MHPVSATATTAAYASLLVSLTVLYCLYRAARWMTSDKKRRRRSRKSNPVGLIGATLGVVAMNRQRRRDREARRAAVTLSTVQTLSPTQFEEKVGELLVAHGELKSAMRVGGPGDLGADLIGTTPKGKYAVVQCKRYASTNKVTSPEMQLFIGMITVHHKADVGIFVTTSTLTRHAAALASDHSPLVHVIDGAILASMLSNA